MSHRRAGRGHTLRVKPIAALIASSSFAALISGQVYAQEAQATEAPENKASDALSMNRVVVTGTSQARSKMRSSLSVTDVEQDQIKDFSARSESEVLLLIPGIQTEAGVGPGGNANISVRGLPISSGGSKYVQLQEDGLPTVQFGDMNFANNDYWIRFDNNVDSIQALRGGSSSVFASHAPGAVINYISKTGKEEGGSIGLSRGLNYRETRFDGDFGAHLAPDLYYHIGGYYREGEGPRKSTANSLQGYQFKGNITKEFNGGKGYIRVNVKLLNEHAPTYQAFLSAKQSGNSFGSFSQPPGFDGARGSQYSIYNSTMSGIDPLTHQLYSGSLVDGITANSKSLGFEFHNVLENGYTLDNKFRVSQNSGAFQAQFWDLSTLSTMLSRFGSGATSARYYNGPNVGQVVTADNLQAGLVSQGAAIHVTSSDMGNLVNDLSLSKLFKTSFGSVEVHTGLFHSTQNVVQRWSINERVTEAAQNGAVLDVYNAAGVALTTAGLTGYNNQWGGCCARDIDAKFTTNAPYLGLNASVGDFDLDGGVRHESFSANGSYIAGTKGAKDVNGDGAITGAENTVYLIDPTAQRGLVDYRIHYNNYSLGVNYRVSKDLSVFVRNSKGHRAMSDRFLFSSNIDAVTGKLTAGGQSAALAVVKQSELGVKYRGRADWGDYGLAATYFRSTTNEFDYDQGRQDDPSKPGYAGPKLNVLGYKSSGVELESGGSIGNLALVANLVYSDETMTANQGDPSRIGMHSGGTPKVRYTISPRYEMGPAVVGMTVRGQSKVFTDAHNTVTINGHYILNAFLNYDFGNNIVGSLNANNLANKLYPTSGGGFVSGSTTVFGAGVETGRTISASLRYRF
jgi:outer membrane receptor protein involved in Fe transport